LRAVKLTARQERGESESMAEEGGGGADDAHFEAQLQQREQDVDALLRASKPADALRRALLEPPFASKNPAVKDRSVALVQKALVAVGVKEENLLTFIAGVDPDGADVLMKNVVRLLGASGPNSPLFLKTHGLLVEKCGLGCLVRSIVDRRVA
jgi:hypothetical protein